MPSILRLVMRVIAPLLSIVAVAVLIWKGVLGGERSACDALRRADLRTIALLDEAHVSCSSIASAKADQDLSSLIRSNAVDGLVHALRRRRGLGLALSPNAEGMKGIARRIAAFEHVPGLRAVTVSPDLIVVVPGVELTFTDRERDALSYVARAMLRGAREPSVTSFPAALRRVLRSEVMVTLSEHGEPRLWRSARGTSIARSLLTATRVARDRWREREASMGGPLAEQLSHLDVTVDLLVEDGTFESTQAGFIDRAVSKSHGIGIDYRSDWYYALPEAAHKQQNSAYRGLLTLLSDRGLSASAITEPGSRVYRFVPVELSVSRALPSTARSASEGDSD